MSQPLKSKRSTKKRESKFSNIRGSNKPNRKESSAKQPRIPQSKQNVAEESAEAQAEYERSLEASLTDNEVLAAFERMLEDMGLTGEKAAPLRSRDMKMKRDMVLQYMKRQGPSAAGRNDSQMKPGDYVVELHSTAASDTGRYHSILSSLRVSLTSNPISWVQQFGEKGLDVILKILAEYNQRDGKKFAEVRHECIKCIKAFMNNKYGIQTVFAKVRAITHIASALNPQHENMTIDATKLLAAVCFVPPDGHEKVLSALTEVGESKSSPRFSPIVEALHLEDNPQLMCVCMQLVNAIISNPEDLDFRLHLRNEFLRTGMSNLLPELRDNQSEELGVQMRVFDEHREDDFEEFQHRFEGLRVEMDDLEGNFQLLQQVVANTPSENYFLSILQHLILIREDTYIRPQYFKLIEECISQIVLHKSGCDPDMSYTKRFDVDVGPLIEGLAEKAKYESIEGKADKLEKELETEVTARQESEAKLSQANKKVEETEKELEELKQRVASGAVVAATGPVPPPPPGGSVPPPPPPPPGMGGGPPPPPPPPPGMGGGPPPPPPPPGMGGGPPPPPPPPGMGGPPGPPPPPGGVPMLGGLGFKGMSPVQSLPHGMKEKKKYNPQAPMKRANWSKIQPRTLGKHSLWVNAKEDKLEKTEVLEQLAALFASKPGKKLGGGGGIEADVDGKTETKKKVKELKVLSAKEAQNLSIWLGSMRIPHEEIKRRILEIDEEHLNEGLVQSLLKNMPEPETLKQVYALKDEFNDMNEAEQFCVQVGSIKGLQKRLQAILFKMKFPELITDIKPEIATVTKACEELKHSKSFNKLLELILLFGNYMNSGSRNAGSLGFDLNFLTKLRGTKSVDNKINFLHFLADQVQTIYPEIADFPETITHAVKASRVSDDNIQKNMKQMKTEIKGLEKDLDKYKPVANVNDRFKSIMEEFLKKAKDQYKVLEGMYSQMKELYTKIAEFYAFDMSKKSMEEFFGDIKTFLAEYEQSRQENKKRSEAEEKAKKAKEAKEKKEQEKKMKSQRKNNLLDMTIDDDQEGVMDNLIEALQSGSAFSRPHKKRGQARAAGAERQRQLERSRSRVGRMMPVSVTEIDINGSASPNMVRTNNTNNAGGRSRGRRGGDQGGQDGDALMERLRQL
ncbi:protein diaphanous homolog 2 isoform X3 [Strongylocentrotus purpuratus]|uniref:Uncharacterized protein n=1 Tax=Strongylocentrotus purpuratus TaxID=7668 RepID=A0A7M7NJ16_STRPU|nr:protein diaphanous homolog 2 isoform X3 [Strongylocentrotus purpuratus]